MAKFKSYVGKQVMLALSVFTFADEEVIVSDPDTIKALRSAADVQELDDDDEIVSPLNPAESEKLLKSLAEIGAELAETKAKLEKAEAEYIAESDLRKKSDEDLIVERGLREKAEAELADALKKPDPKSK